ncbi:MAG: glycoside hydrolase family 32 protein [Bacteroidia bacterium]|nr:glycoside hydrolase family 32 protein [Bacteroidia bacterium]
MKILNLILLSTLLISSCQKRNESIVDKGETYRPKFHFTPPQNWMNDPNGMVYHEGEYHLFYQHYPDSNVWGPMHWGHAVSKDLVQWQHLPIALYPDSLGYIFSGSAVIDHQNTSGFGSLENPAMVAIFTYHLAEGEKAKRNDFQTQGIAYSTDRGRTWTKYEHNPVLINPGIIDFRDPKVSWNEVSGQWVMALAVKDHIEFYGSPNLKRWNKLSEFGNALGAHGGVWECPDLFSLKDEQGNIKWVLFVSINPGGPQGGSATQYFVGDFDGNKFSPQDTVTRWIDYGPDNYAGVTWSNIPATDGRRLFMGWMSNWQYANRVPTYAWRSAMTIPRVLSLTQSDNGLSLSSMPVEEIKSLRDGSEISLPGFLNAADSLSKEITLPKSEVEVVLELTRSSADNDFEIELSNMKGEKLLIGLHGESNQFYIDRRNSGKQDFSPVFGGKHFGHRIMKSNDVRLKLFIDIASVELFADDGTLVMTEIFFPNKPFSILKARAVKKGVNIKAMTIFPLMAISQKQ